ncbi:hypothetical protein MicB006_2545 [Micromonospora sp. B006]|nr:hypothetical protein MicB006_2545 [Micromonospora sp. B006]
MCSHDQPLPLRNWADPPSGYVVRVRTEPYDAPSPHRQMQMARSKTAAGWIAQARSDRQDRGTPAR